MEQEFGTTDEKQKPASFQQDIYAALKLMAEHWGLIGSLGGVNQCGAQFWNPDDVREGDRSDRPFTAGVR
nr:hypothetical protein GCM10020185_18990 [Pseudomonas brassicacearum subsp. brassicacearum]